MGFYDLLKQSVLGRPLNLKEPTFIRDVCDAQVQLEKMGELKKTASPEISKQIEQDLKMLAYGISGENSVAYELKNSFMPILILRDVHLEYKGLSAQIDYVVIDTKFILVIECKKMTGDIEVTNNGDFIRLFKNSVGKVYKREGIYSPFVQNERHLELIKHILIDEMASMNEKKIKDLLHTIVVFANSKTIVNIKYAKADIKKSIIRYDQLISHMKALHDSNKDGYWIPEEGMYRIAEILMAHHKENVIDYTQKYGLGLHGNQTGEVKAEIASTLSKSIEETPIYKDLREYRLITSRKEAIKPYYIYNNVQLEEIISLMPETNEELMQIKGFAYIKCQKYGDDIISIIKKFKSN